MLQLQEEEEAMSSSLRVFAGVVGATENYSL